MLEDAAEHDPAVRAGNLRLGWQRRERHAGTQHDGGEPFHQMPHWRLLPVGQDGPGPWLVGPARTPLRNSLAWPDEKLRSLCRLKHPRWPQDAVAAGHSLRPDETVGGAGASDAVCSS